jgi:hypothetical protein
VLFMTMSPVGLTFMILCHDLVLWVVAAFALFTCPRENIGIVMSHGDMRKHEVTCREWTRKRHENCCKMITQSCVPFVWEILTTRRGTKWKKQVLMATTTLCCKAVSQ